MRANKSHAKVGHQQQQAPEGGWHEVLADGTPVWIRPIRKQDVRLEREFLRRLSEQGRHDRFVGVVQPPSAAAAQHLANIESDGQVGLIAIVRQGGHDLEVGAGGYCRTFDGIGCHAAIAVDDAWRKRGIGRLLAHHLIDMAREGGIRHAYIVDPVGRAEHHRLALGLGFRSRPDPEDPAATVFVLEL